MFPYHICVWNRLVTLPRDFVTDLATLGQDAFAFLVLSLLWTQHSKVEVEIEITAATPDTEFECLSDNLPLRRLKATQLLEVETELLEPENKLSGFVAYLNQGAGNLLNCLTK